MSYYDEFDQESQALLHDIQPLDFEEVMGSKQKSPLDNIRTEKSLGLEEITKGYANRSPFGANSIFAIQNGEFFSGYTDFLNVLRRIGAIIPEFDEEVENKGIQLEEVVIQAKPVSPRVFNYLEYSSVSPNFINYWRHKRTDYSGQAILNKKIAYLDTEKIFLSITGSGITRYSLYIPYSNDSNVSINNSNIAYLEKNAAVIIKDLEIDGLTTILSFLEDSRRGEYLDRIYKNTAEEIERNHLNSPALLTILDNLTIAFLKHFKTKSLDTIFFGLLKMSLEEKNEIILLKTLQTIYSKTDFNPDAFLNKLIVEKINGKTAFQILYDNMNDWGGENNFSKLIIELTKIWLLSSYSDKENKIYNKYEPTQDLVYDQKIILGFRDGGLDFEFDGDKELLITNNTFFIELPGLSTKQRYHIFQPIKPIDLNEKQNEDLSLAEGIPIPAFYLKAFNDKGVWENFEKTAWLIQDIVSTFTGIGNLVKFRYLVKAGKASKLIYLRLAYGIVEVSLGTISIGLSLIENSGNKDLIYKIRMYLFWAEICTLGADLLSTRILTKQASEAKDALNEYRKTVTNKKKLGEIEEFEKHLDNVIRNGDEIGLYGGRILSKNEIEEWAKIIFKKYGTKLELVDDFGHPNILAQFDATTNTIKHKKDVTKYFLFHETMHADECFSIGKPNYLKDAHIKGTPVSDANLIRTYKREKYVHDKIIEHAKEHGFNNEELLHNWRYFDTHLYNLELENIPIPKN